MREGDFERLFERHASALFGFLLHRTGDRAVAEDLLSDSFERALRARRGFDRRRGTEKSWIYAIALNCLRDHLRRGVAEQRALARAHSRETAPPIADPAEAAERRDAVARALAGLPDEERDAIALRFGASLTIPEIAAATGLPATTVDGRVYRALRRMRAELD